MIIPSKKLREYIDQFPSKEEFCVKAGISYPTLLKYLMNEQPCSTKFIEVITEQMGWDFEKAFDTVEVKIEGKK